MLDTAVLSQAQRERDTDGTHDQCHHAEPEEEAVERACGSGPGGEIGRASCRERV